MAEQIARHFSSRHLKSFCAKLCLILSSFVVNKIIPDTNAPSRQRRGRMLFENRPSSTTENPGDSKSSKTELKP